MGSFAQKQGAPEYGQPLHQSFCPIPSHRVPSRHFPAPVMMQGSMGGGGTQSHSGRAWEDVMVAAEMVGGVLCVLVMSGPARGAAPTTRIETCLQGKTCVPARFFNGWIQGPTHWSAPTNQMRLFTVAGIPSGRPYPCLLAKTRYIESTIIIPTIRRPGYDSTTRDSRNSRSLVRHLSVER